MHPPPPPRPVPQATAIPFRTGLSQNHTQAGWAGALPLSHAQLLSLPVFKTLRWCLAFGLAHTSGPSPSAPQRASGTSVHHAWLLAHRYLIDNHSFSICSSIPSLLLLCCFSPILVLCLRDSFLSPPHLLFKLFFPISFSCFLPSCLFWKEEGRQVLLWDRFSWKLGYNNFINSWLIIKHYILQKFLSVSCQI